MDFEQWFNAVDKHVEIIAGLSVNDLADKDFHGMYSDEYTPREAAEELLESEGYPTELF